MEKVNIQKAIIPSAGLGKRLMPITKVVPKELLPFGSFPAIHYAVNEVVNCGIQQIAIIINERKTAIENFFQLSEDDESKDIFGKVQITYIYQKELRGLGNAILECRGFISDQPFVIVLPDNIIPNSQGSLSALIICYKNFGCSCIGLTPINEENAFYFSEVYCKPVSSGIFQIIRVKTKNETRKKRKANVEKRYGIVGRYIFKPRIFDHLEHIKMSVAGEFSEEEAINALIEEENVYGIELTNEVYDIGTIKSYKDSLLQFLLKESNQERKRNA